MNIKNFLGGIVVSFILLVVNATAGTVQENLERRINNLPAQTTLLNNYRISKLIKAIVNVTSNEDRFKCEEVSYIKNSAKFKTSYDADGRPCRIYDLSFPTLLGSGKSIKRLASIPLKKYEPEVYDKWLDGDFEYVTNKTQEYINSFTPATYRSSWVARLPFKNSVTKNKSGYVKSFYLSDIKLRRFAFTRDQKRQLNELFATQKGNASLAKLQQFVDHPEKLLGKIKLNWNDLKKVYEVFLEFDFLPLRGPVALVDYNAQYKFMVERMIRSTMQKAFLFITNRVTSGNVNRLISLGINESFGFLDMAYMYHLNQLENTLRLNLEAVVPTEVSKADIDKGMNILFASQESILTQYIMGLATGQPVDIDRLDVMGKAARYTAEKNRRNTMRTLYSNLTIKKKCQMKVVSRYFGECINESNDRFLYSLLASHKVLIWDLGATKLHNYQSPGRIALMRKSAYLLSSALNIFRISFVPSFITDQLVSILKDYSLNGVLEEGVMLNELTERRRIGESSDEDEYHIKWLFKQNFNPFLAKSLEMENRLIESASH